MSTDPSTPDTSTPDPSTPSSSTPAPPKVGELFHWLHDGLAFNESTFGAAGMLSKRGLEMTITESMLTANTDRKGRCWLNLLHDTVGQDRRWGRQMLAPGPFPGDAVREEVGTYEYEDAVNRAYREARAIPDRQQRATALADVEARYGPQPTTNTTLAQYSNKA